MDFLFGVFLLIMAWVAVDRMNRMIELKELQLKKEKKL